MLPLTEAFSTWPVINVLKTLTCEIAIYDTITYAYFTPFYLTPSSIGEGKYWYF